MQPKSLRLLGLAVVAASGLWATNASAACNDGRNRNVTVINRTAVTVRELYGSRVTTSSWEEDVLGSRVLPAGQSINVNWDDNSCECLFDFKAVLTNGNEIVARRINVCTESAWVIQ